MNAHDEAPHPTTDRHRRAVAAVQELFRLFPKEASNWLCSRERGTNILEASFLEQAPKGPAYAVPPLQSEPERPAGPEAVLRRVLTRSLVHEVEGSGEEGSIRVLDFDFDEARRQTIAQGGCEVELVVRVKVARHKPFDSLLGIGLPGEQDDGSEMPWHMAQKSSWNMLAYTQLVLPRIPRKEQRGGCFSLISLYLWPGTGLKDPQELCSVGRVDDKLPGFLGAIVESRSAAEKEREQASNRKHNLQRRERHDALDRARREAAARRRERTGDAGITEEELAELVPAIDIDTDSVSFQLSYEILRLWDEPVDALLEELPPACVGLALFGHRPAGVAIEDVLRQCAWTLRRGLRDAEPAELQRAATVLGALAEVHVDPAVVKRTLASMKLSGQSDAPRPRR